MAFNQLLNSDTLRYSGTRKESYSKWSQDFKREIEALALTDSQQLDLLKAKTSGVTRAVIQPITRLETEIATVTPLLALCHSSLVHVIQVQS